MPLELGVWRIDKKLTQVSATKLAEEARLEELIEQDIRGLIRDDLMVIGRQVRTAHGHFIDLLAINSDGNLTVLELKRDRTPRDVVAQTLDYGLWIDRLNRDEVFRIFAEYQKKYASGRPEVALEAAWAERFGGQLPETINESHELLIVAAELDESTERIIEYLVEYGVPVNAVFFRVFKDADREYLTRAWLRDPTETQAKSEEAQARHKGKEAWNGADYYVSFGQDDQRNWDDARTYGFVSAGGGAWYTRTLRQLQRGHRVFVHIPRVGYVGVGKVTSVARRAEEFTVTKEDGSVVPISTMPLKAKDMFHDSGKNDLAETVVGVEWLKIVPLDRAVWENGFFANQNSACKLRSRFTIERLTERFGLKAAE